MAPPLLIPPASMMWLLSRWQTIPARYPLHFGASGQPDAWQTRSARHVLSPFLFGEGMVVWILAIALFAWFATGKRQALPPVSKIMVALSYLLAIVFTSVGLMLVMQLPVWPVIFAGPLGTICLLIYLVQMEPDKTPGNNLIVEKSNGMGYSLNFAYPGLKLFLLALLAGIVLLLGFLIWSQG